MNPPVRNTENPVDIEALLRNRLPAEPDADCEGVEQVAMGLSPGATGAEKREAQEHLRECPACAEALLVLHSMQDQGVVPVASVQRVDFSPGAHRFGETRRVLATAAGLFVIALSVVLALLLGGKPRTGGEDLVVKGSADRIFLAVERGEARFTLHEGERLLEGDRIQLFYSAEQDGHLLVLNVDATGDMSVLVPAKGERSIPLKAGERRPLAGGGIVREGQGWEWIVAVFSDRPANAEEWRKILRRAWKERTGSKLEVPPGEARNVLVLTMKR